MPIADYTEHLPVIGGTVLVIIASTFIFWSYGNNSKRAISVDDLMLNVGETWNSDEKGNENDPQEVDSAEDKKDGPQLRNVFDVKQPPPNVGNPKVVSKGSEADKPFKSSYYYAHNQMKKTGGYTDGLKAEDYVMNGPKLLKKSSVTKTPEVATHIQAVTKKTVGSSNPINRYLWDDDGNDNGVAKIYIDTLPGKTPIPFADANITKADVMSKIVGDSNSGLILQLRGNVGGEKENRYHLYVPRMFGEVEEVKTIVKAKKLIVKLTKKKGKGNVKAWPQLPSKVTKPISNDTVDYVNEDLFASQS